MSELAVYRVYRIRTNLVWSGQLFNVDTLMMPPSLRYLLEEHVVVPKKLAPRVAKLVCPYSDTAAKVIEAYPASYHHAAVQEFGIGLGITPGKWVKEWPQFTWEVLEELNGDLGWVSIRHEWSMEQLVTQQNAHGKMVHGVGKAAWDMLRVLTKAKTRRTGNMDE